MFRAVNITPCDAIMVGTGHYMFAQTHRMNTTMSDPNVDCGLRGMMTCTRSFVKVPHVPSGGDTDSGEAWAGGSIGDIWESLYLCLNFAVNLNLL